MASLHRLKWERYRDTRIGTYEFRCRTRYGGARLRLLEMGLNDSHTLVDVGAGTCQFGNYLRERGWRGEYIPIDAVIDGTDLETWNPKQPADFFACIEVAEHLHNPYRLIAAMAITTRYGLVLTTPNPEAVDVIACDPTHVSEIPARRLQQFGFEVERVSWFGIPDDTLLAWRGPLK